jgi:hypothetical protein
MSEDPSMESSGPPESGVRVLNPFQRFNQGGIFSDVDKDYSPTVTSVVEEDGVELVTFAGPPRQDSDESPGETPREGTTPESQPSEGTEVPEGTGAEVPDEPVAVHPAQGDSADVSELFSGPKASNTEEAGDGN